ncbi:hypothetical protein SAMN05421640_2489 [Ekhidna lutea]|uniref:Uncharacterized protein n=1 Tax=Ekhidna lutea TaxID=447679 RepID=A0A239K861_EKHLU|nr:hypothetical protein [Ekhidna lutea]SNT14285.1 hypothetical protein SAMN05421640_2489 [Ekhidna lutea]
MKYKNLVIYLTIFLCTVLPHWTTGQSTSLALGNPTISLVEIETNETLAVVELSISLVCSNLSQLDRLVITLNDRNRSPISQLDYQIKKENERYFLISENSKVRVDNNLIIVGDVLNLDINNYYDQLSVSITATDISGVSTNPIIERIR